MIVDTMTESIRRFVVDTFPLARTQSIGVDDRLLETGIVDSLGVLSLVGYLEAEFSVTIEDDDLVPENFQTIGRLAAFIQSKIAR